MREQSWGELLGQQTAPCQLCLSVLDYYFTRDDMALSKFTFFFQHVSKEKYEQAGKFLTFQNYCGGRVLLVDVRKPEQDEWGNGASAMAFALHLENVNQTPLDLHQIASRHGDAHTCDFLEIHYLDEEVKLIKKLGDHVTNLNHVHSSEDGLGKYLFDCLTLGKSSN